MVLVVNPVGSRFANGIPLDTAVVAGIVRRMKNYHLRSITVDLWSINFSQDENMPHSDVLVYITYDDRFLSCIRSGNLLKLFKTLGNN